MSGLRAVALVCAWAIWLLGEAVAAAPTPAPAPVPPSHYLETPELEAAVAAGKLPPVQERLPEHPSVARLAEFGKIPGRPGGDLHLLMARPKDIRMMTVYGYARLVAYDENLNIVPDILERVDVQDGRVFTLHLRKGHKWSDGHPFTAEDFRYYWEDVANNKDLSPLGLQKELLVGGKPPRFEVIDSTTVRYSWSQPNPYFLPALAGALPLFIYRPAHYLRQFHIRYANPEKLKKMVEEGNWRSWASLHASKDEQYRADNPDLPVLQPWVNTTPLPSEHFIFKRNPYYYRVDKAGRQLPYIDDVVIDIVEGKLIPAKTGAGDSDLQARYLRFDDYTFLKAGEKRNDYSVRLWRTAKGSQVALYPNLNAVDPVWHKVIQDVRFRRALSLAVHRHEINQVIYYGLGIEGNNTVLPQSPLFEPRYQKVWADYDLDRANALLDEMGLVRSSRHGLRRLPDGRPLGIIVETAGESTEQTDVLSLIRDSWAKAGIKLYIRPSQREVFRNRVFSGQAMMSVWQGLTNALATASMSPEELAPTAQQQLQWPMWGQYYETDGAAGKPPDLPAVKELVDLNRQWRLSTTSAEQARIWHRMLEINADRMFTIGTVAGVPQPVVVSNRLRNVPEKGIYNWDPGAYFGIYRPDTFWFAGPGKREEE